MNEDPNNLTLALDMWYMTILRQPTSRIISIIPFSWLNNAHEDRGSNVRVGISSEYR